jgi:hypothetical protein
LAHEGIDGKIEFCLFGDGDEASIELLALPTYPQFFVQN